MGFSPCPVQSVSDCVSFRIYKSIQQRQREFCRVVLAIGALLIAATSWAKAGTFVAFGPQDYQRGTGAPVTVTTNFSVLNPNTQYTLKAFNGGLQDDQTELVSNSIVTVNGIQVIGSNNFNQQVTEVDVPVTLQGSNTLTVEVRGRPGGLLTIEIIGVDNDPPTIQATVSPAPNAAGWNNTNVTVTFICGDATSPVASCPAPKTVISEGANQVISGTATDAAGNSASTSVTLNIDKTPPVISITSPANGATVSSSSISVSGVVSDGLSGIAAVTCDGILAPVQNGSFSCSVTLTSGANTITTQAIDIAGNISSFTENVTFSIPPPVISSFSPHSARAGGLSFTLTLNGANFSPSSIVEWNGSSRATTFVSGSQLQATILATDLVSPGTVTVTVVNPSPGGSSNSVTFTIAVVRIAFASGRGFNGSVGGSNIWFMNPDGSEQVLVSSFGGGASNPVWSPDGSRIALDVGNNIFVINPDGSGLVSLTGLSSNPFMNISPPQWSPDGSKIAYSSPRALDGSSAVNTNFTGNLWLANADGSGGMPLTSYTDGTGTSNFMPRWSPDGSKIAFISSAQVASGISTNGSTNIWLINADGSGATPLTTITALDVLTVNPVWSPDGTKIVFESARALDGSNAVSPGQVTNVWTINADGSGLTPLTKLTFCCSNVPVWSPDGSKIAFFSSRALDGSDNPNAPNFALNLWLMNADGSGATPLTKGTQVGAAAVLDPVVWSPDGSQIIFDSRRALNGSDAFSFTNTSNIWVIGADGSGLTPLTTGALPGADSVQPNEP